MYVQAPEEWRTWCTLLKQKQILLATVVYGICCLDMILYRIYRPIKILRPYPKPSSNRMRPYYRFLILVNIYWPATSSNQSGSGGSVRILKRSRLLSPSSRVTRGEAFSDRYSWRIHNNPTQRWVKYGVRSPKFIWAPVYTVQLLSLDETMQPPPPCIWAHIRGRYWSARIDISLWPSGLSKEKSRGQVVFLIQFKMSIVGFNADSHPDPNPPFYLNADSQYGWGTRWGSGSERYGPFLIVSQVALDWPGRWRGRRLWYPPDRWSPSGSCPGSQAAHSCDSCCSPISWCPAEVQLPAPPVHKITRLSLRFLLI